MASNPYIRPNGRPQACEPCRKRKVSCDHTHPICRRCIKRKQQSECVYVPQDSARRTPQPKSQAHGTVPVPARVPASPPRSVDAGTTPQLPVVLIEPTPIATATGYVGSTSYCHFFREAEQLLITAQAAGSPTGDSCGCDSLKPGVDFETVRDQCRAALDLLPDMSGGLETFRLHDCSATGIPPIIQYRIIQSVCDILGPYLGSDRDPQQLQAIARQLCRNSTKPLDDSEPDPERWISQFLGDNLRWESIGILFTMTTRIQGDPRSTIFDSGVSVRNWASTARKGLGLTLELCTELSKGSYMSLYFSQKMSVAESMFSGDASLRTWRTHGATVAMLTFLGYHALPDEQPYEPTLTSELKRRLYGWILAMDCGVSYFTGRPPLMSSKYSTTPMPLDLHDEELLDPEALKLAVSQLDNGWKRNATHTNSGTFTRCRTLLGTVRESISVLAIGDSRPSSLDMLLDMKTRVIQIYESFPRIVRYNPQDGRNKTTGSRTHWTQMLIALEYLQTLLFIERLLLKHNVKEDRAELVAISFELLVSSLPVWTHSDCFGPGSNDAEWLVMAFSAPAGGVLCHELLKPSVDLSTAFTGEAGASMAPYRLDGSPITRASIIQKLSLLVGFLGWIHPSAPNAEICCEARVVVQGVLDQALNNPVPLDSDAPPLPLTLAPEFSDWDFNTVLDFDCDLLNTFDWLRT